MNKSSQCALAFFLAFVFASCSRPTEVAPAPVEPAWFEDVTAKLGIDFVHEAGPVSDPYFMPLIMGSGVAALDFNNDGRIDLLFLQNGGPNSKATNRLYRQLPDGTFKDVTAGSGIDFAGWNMGVAVGDVNNDGWLDLVITQYGGIKLLLGDGTGKFRDATQEAGLANPGWGASACFVDYDRDGWLDLMVVNYLEFVPGTRCEGVAGQPDFCHPKTFSGTPARLFRNRSGESGGKQVRFQDVSLSSGIGKLPGRGLGVVALDINGDGWPDLFIANDGHANHLWINQRDGTFVEEAIFRGAALNGLGQVQANMGIAIGDFHGSGMFDLFVTHLTEETHTLWRQYERGRFQDVSASSGITQSRWRGTGFGTVAADFNNDGWLDIALANGRVAALARSTGSFWQPYQEKSQIFRNNGRGVFRDISDANPALSGPAQVARGLAVADLDNDGGVDLVLTQIAGPVRVLRNVAPARGHWLRLKTFDAQRRRDTYGAEIRVYASGKTWLTLLNPGQSYLSSNDPRAHVGLDDVTTVDRIEVRWPDGSREEFAGGPTDREVIVQQGTGKPLAP